MPFSSADPNAYLGLGMQSAAGTPQTTATKLRFAKYITGNNVENNLNVVYMREGGDGLDYGFSYKNLHKGQGQLVANMRPEIIGQVLQVVLGGATWNGASAPATHIFHTGHASFPWTTMFVQHPGSDLTQMYSDVLFSGFTIEGNAGDPWKITAPFTAITPGASYTALTPTYIAEDPFLYHNSPTYVIDGSGDTRVTAFKLDAAYNVEELQTQAVTLDSQIVQSRDFSLEITRRYESSTLWKKVYMGGGVAPTQSVATGSFRAAVQYGSGAAQRNIDLNIPLLSYTGDALTELDPDGKTVYETISAKPLKGATHIVFASINNGHASAYAS